MKNTPIHIHAKTALLVDFQQKVDELVISITQYGRHIEMRSTDPLHFIQNSVTP